MVNFKSFLNTTVLEEKKPVTYKCLSRNLNINVNLAKQALYQYAISEPTVTAIYCITGTLEEKTTSIQLVESNKLEDAKQRYLQISSIHVYSIMPYQPKDLSVLTIANKDIMDTSREDRIRNGLIRNNGIEMETANLQNKTTKPIVNTQISTHTKQQSKTVTTLNDSTKSHSKSSKSIPAKRKGTLSFENMGSKSKKTVTEKPSPTKETPKPQPETKKRVIKSIQESDDDEDEDEDEESLDARLARSATIQVNDIFSDDDDEVMEDDSKSIKNVKNEKEASPDMDIDIDHDDDHIKKNTKSSALSNEDEDHEATPGKTRRKVEKKKTYKNERGFLVTETVWEWEEVETDAENKEATKSPSSLSISPSSQQPKSAKKSMNSKKTEQKSLLSFWGKK
ncbi:unnamed protein product [Cunninghamella blakesleeana]